MTKLQIVRSVMELARRDRAIITNPAADVQSPGTEPERVGQVLDDDDIALLLEASEEVDESIAGVVWLMARAGLRIGEALAIRRSDIDFTTGTINVQRTLTRSGEFKAPKGRKREDQGRTIPMPPDLTDRLRKHVEETSILSIDGLLFTGAQGRPLSYTNWRRRKWNRITEMAGLDAVPHDLRHTVATRLMVVDRWSPAEVQHFLGHRDPRVTLAIYTHINTDDLPTPSALSKLA
jgi:integrase